jgi:hypothetical protein
MLDYGAIIFMFIGLNITFQGGPAKQETPLKVTSGYTKGVNPQGDYVTITHEKQRISSSDKKSLRLRLSAQAQGKSPEVDPSQNLIIPAYSPRQVKKNLVQAELDDAALLQAGKISPRQFLKNRLGTKWEPEKREARYKEVKLPENLVMLLNKVWEGEVLQLIRNDLIKPLLRK